MSAVGKTEESWRKHEILEDVIGAFVGAANAKLLGMFRHAQPGLIIDFNAGDAKGVTPPQGDMFRVSESTTTPAIAERVCDKYGWDGLLCEINRKHRTSLVERFPQFAVIGDHANAPSFVENMKPLPTNGVCTSDPNGHGQHGIEHMAKLGQIVRKLDFVIVHPYGALMRHLGVNKEGNDDHHKNGAAVAASRAAVEKYEWMRDQDNLDRWGDYLPSLEWAVRLGRTRMATTRVISASRGFRYRIMVVSNYLPHGITRNPLFQEIR